MQLSTPITINQLSELIDFQLVTGEVTVITGINEIHKVQKGDLTFVDHPKYYQKSLTSAASVVLINKADVANPQNKTLLVCNDPFTAYNTLTRHFRPTIAWSSAIHESATIGQNTMIAPNVTIGEKVSIGNNCKIYPNVTIYGHCHIGNDVTIHANTVIGADAYYFQKRTNGYQKMHTCGRVIIEDKVEIGAACTIDKGVSGDTIIGEGTKLDNQVHIGHGVVVGKHCLMAAQVGVAGKTHIGDHVILWGQVGVSKSLKIGDNAIVYAQSGVSKSLKGNEVYFGSPAQEARQQMREMAFIKRIPEIWKRIKKLTS